MAVRGLNRREFLGLLLMTVENGAFGRSAEGAFIESPEGARGFQGAEGTISVGTTPGPTALNCITLGGSDNGTWSFFADADSGFDNTAWQTTKFVGQTSGAEFDCSLGTWVFCPLDQPIGSSPPAGFYKDTSATKSENRIVRIFGAGSRLMGLQTANGDITGDDGVTEWIEGEKATFTQ